MLLFGWRGNIARFAFDPIGYIGDWRSKYGDVFAMTRGGIPLNTRTRAFPGSVMAIGPKYNQLVLSDTHRFHNGLVLGTEGTRYERLGAGLLNMNEEKHKQQRRMIMPAFQKSRVESYHADMASITQNILDSWRPGQARDLAPQMRKIALRIAAKALFDLDVSAEADHVGGMIERWLRASSSPLLVFMPLNLPLMPYWRLLRLSRELDDTTRGMIDRIRQTTPNNSILAVLAHTRDEDGTRMSEDELIGQANLLFIAGHETTANALTWTLFLLSQHPRVVADLHDELASELHGAAPRVEQLPRLPLLERVIKESMRLFPPVPFGARTCMQGTDIGCFSVPPGTEIVFSQYFTQRMTEIYPAPTCFRPERWEGIDPTAYEYLPFLAGARMCIGATFAMQEIKIVLAMILQRFRLELVPRSVIERRVTMTLSSRNGLPMILHPQDRRFAASPWRGNVREMLTLDDD
jgi:cytochrome P450